MRITPTALAATTRKVLVSTAAAAVLTGVSFFGGGTAAATTLQDESCTSAISGPVGDDVVLAGATVKGVVKTAAEEARGFWTLLTVWPDHLANEIAKEQLPVGTVPNAPSGKIDGATVGAAVREALKDEHGLGATADTKRRTLDHITKKVAGTCGFVVRAANYVAPTTSSPKQQPRSGSGGGQADTPSSPGSTSAPGSASLLPQGSGTGYAAPRDYGDIPAAQAPSAGIAVPPDLRYAPSSGTPGETPEFGILGADGRDGSDGGRNADVRNAGNADALAADHSPGDVQLPMLLAVVALAGVTAALVRTWVLRKVS
ncbi:hypothetical protein B0I33_105247 [Prauserella shujinwangii]|uniref:MYXO-CTERM domain-containing protein n=1 Tax=Prauserella shujinwangii TaxID=1453103 RepID=A0A2T0LV35_9PSEU|nr:hypothetical protein [Prauserella shujinwangii]PRX47667.1 hypothetical protein B0I33_105247 [Prauserella shujinwangii]